MKTRASLFRKHIALPQDHGSWVFILSPLLIGLFAGGALKPESLNLIVAAMGAFLLRQPVSMAVKAYSGRRPRADLPAARTWMLVYGALILLALAGLVTGGVAYILYLAIPGIPVFVWHLVLVSRRAERRQAGMEILATGALSLAAPAAYWIGQGRYDPLGWALWLLTWLQSAASIVYAYLRLEQRTMGVNRHAELDEAAELARPGHPKSSYIGIHGRAGDEAQSKSGALRQPFDKLRMAAQGGDRTELWRMGKRAFQYTSFNLALALALGWSAWLPRWIFVPYLLQWLETIWGITHPATGWKPTAIGLRQLVVSTLFTLLFILCWRL
jgi:hypothetical protein